MDILFIAIWFISMIIPAFQKSIEDKCPIVLKIYLCIIPILLAYLLTELKG